MFNSYGNITLCWWFFKAWKINISHLGGCGRVGFFFRSPLSIWIRGYAESETSRTSSMSLAEWSFQSCPQESQVSIGFGDNTDLIWWNNVNNQFCQLTTRVWYQRGIRRPFKCTGNHTYWGLKITEAFNPKMFFKICERIPCSSFSVKELDVIVHKKYFPSITMLNFGHSVPHITSEPGGWGGN